MTPIREIDDMPWRRRHPIWAAAILVAAMLAIHAVPLPAAAEERKSEGPSPALWEPFDRSQFGTPLKIDNPWLPMKPGTRWVYQGTTTEDDGKAVLHRLEVVVTRLTKAVDGIPTVVSYDEDTTNHELAEAEIAFYAQDDAGNVWLFGEYPEEYDNGKFVKAPAWLHGRQGARAGVMMMAHPQLGTPSYSEGWGPTVHWTDRGLVHQTGEKVSVPTGKYSDVLVIKESAQSEPDAEQLKYYARGTGNVRVSWMGDPKKARETLDLVLVEQLGPTALRQIEAKAIALDGRARKRAREAFAGTESVRAAGSTP